MDNPDYSSARYIAYKFYDEYGFKKHTTFKALLQKGISSTWNETYAMPGEPVHFRVCFEYVDQHLDTMDIIEGESRPVELLWH